MNFFSSNFSHNDVFAFQSYPNETVFTLFEIDVVDLGCWFEALPKVARVQLTVANSHGGWFKATGL